MLRVTYVSNIYDFVACGCDVRGVEKGDLTCNSSGICNCRCDVVGDKCNMCQVGHQGFPDCDGMSTKEGSGCVFF